MTTLEIRVGEDGWVEVPVTKQGIAFDITGAKFWFQVRARAYDTEFIIEKSTDDGSVIHEPLNRRALVHIQQADTADKIPGVYYWRAWILTEDLEKYVLNEGIFRLMP